MISSYVLGFVDEVVSSLAIYVGLNALMKIKQTINKKCLFSPSCSGD